MVTLIFLFATFSILNAQWCSGDLTVTIDISMLNKMRGDNFKIVDIIEDGEKSRRNVKIIYPFEEDKKTIGFKYPNGCGIGNLTLTIVNKSTKDKMTLDLNCLMEGYPNFHINKFKAGYYKMNYCELINCGKDESKDAKNDCREKQVLLKEAKRTFPKIVIINIKEFKEEEKE